MSENPLSFAEFGSPRTMTKLPEFRYAVPESTTTEMPKLQQAWRCMETGGIEWQTVPRVVVSDEEFRRHQPLPL